MTKTTELVPPHKFPLFHICFSRDVVGKSSTHLGWHNLSPTFPPTRLSIFSSHRWCVCIAVVRAPVWWVALCTGQAEIVHALPAAALFTQKKQQQQKTKQNKKKTRSWLENEDVEVSCTMTFATRYPTQTTCVVWRLASVWMKLLCGNAR